VSNKSARQSLNKVGEGKRKLKVNGSQNRKGLGMHERKKIYHLTRILMDLSLENNRIKVMVREVYSV